MLEVGGALRERRGRWPLLMPSLPDFLRDRFAMIGVNMDDATRAATQCSYLYDLTVKRL